MPPNTKNGRKAGAPDRIRTCGLCLRREYRWLRQKAQGAADDRLSYCKC